MIDIKDIAERLGGLNEKLSVQLSQECGSSVWFIPETQPNCHTATNCGVVRCGEAVVDVEWSSE